MLLKFISSLSLLIIELLIDFLYFQVTEHQLLKPRVVEAKSASQSNTHLCSSSDLEEQIMLNNHVKVGACQRSAHSWIIISLRRHGDKFLSKSASVLLQDEDASVLTLKRESHLNNILLFALILPQQEVVSLSDDYVKDLKISSRLPV